MGNNTLNVYSNDVRLFLPKTFINVGMQSANDTQHTIDESSGRFNGLLEYLDKNNLLNNQSIVTLRGSPEHSPEYGLSKLFEIKDTYSYYCSQAENGCIIFDFPKGSFNMIYYALRPWKNYKNGVFPSKWTVQIAQTPNLGPDDQSWTTVDSRESDILKNGTALFVVQNPGDFCSAIKFTQLSTNNVNNRSLVLSSIELYGAWKEHKDEQKS